MRMPKHFGIGTFAVLLLAIACRTTDSNPSSSASDLPDISALSNVDLCLATRSYAKQGATAQIGVQKIDSALQKRLEGTGADSVLINGSDKARFEYVRQLTLDAYQYIYSLLTSRLTSEGSSEQARSTYEQDSYLAQPPASGAKAPAFTYWKNDFAGFCQSCDSSTMQSLKTVLDSKLKELEACTWDETQTAEGLNLTKTSPVVTDLIDFIKSEKKAEKLCDVALYYSFGDKAQCAHDFIRSSCESFIQEGKKPNLDSQGTAKLKDALQACVTSYGGERAGRAARLAMDKFHNTLQEGGSYAQAAAEATCTGGAALIGAKIQTTRVLDFENACRDLSPFSAGFFSKERAAACFNTSASVCRVAFTSGSLGVYKVIPQGASVATDEARKLIYAAEGALCGKTVTTSVACNTIQEAGKQIYEAILTGNNDWAHCVGTDKLGACLGGIYGAKGWTNNEGVEQPKQMASGDSFRACCWCKRRFYANDRWIRNDTMFRTENWFGVIQQGDTSTGNCAFQDEKVVRNQGITHNGHEVYYKYDECGKWYVSGDTCSAAAGFTHQVWDGKNKKWFSVSVP